MKARGFWHHISNRLSSRGFAAPGAGFRPSITVNAPITITGTLHEHIREIALRQQRLHARYLNQVAGNKADSFARLPPSFPEGGQ
jgi:hypothetical protein